MQPNPNSATPLYIQIKELLAGQINAGQFAVGDRLPSERELSESCHVSRMTARQALQLLQQEGLTRRQVGKGTYVARPEREQERGGERDQERGQERDLERNRERDPERDRERNQERGQERNPGRDQELYTLNSFTAEMAQRGLSVRSRVVRAELQPADAEVGRQLGVAAGEATVVLQRIRFAGDKPIALETAHLLHRTCPGLLGGHDFARSSLYGVLREVYGIHLVWAAQVIGARMPDRFERDALDLPKRVPVLSLLRVTYAAADRPIEFVRACYHSERFQLRSQLGLPPGDVR